MASTICEQPAEDRAVGNAPMYIVLAGTLVTFLDFFIVNVALPSIERDLDATPSMLSLVVAGYALTFAVGMIPGGRLDDLYGQRRMFAVGIALFTITSAACGVAPTAEVLVIARLLQGAAGAVMTPQVLAILGTVYTGSRRARLAGDLPDQRPGGAGHARAGATGSRVARTAGTPRPSRPGPGERHRVGPGAAAWWRARARLAAVDLALPGGVAGARRGPRRQLRARAARDASPLVDPRLFANRRFSLGLVVTVGFTLVPAAFLFALALYLQQGRGLSALESGTLFVAVGVGYFAALLRATAIAARLGLWADARCDLGRAADRCLDDHRTVGRQRRCRDDIDDLEQRGRGRRCRRARLGRDVPRDEPDDRRPVRICGPAGVAQSVRTLMGPRVSGLSRTGSAEPRTPTAGPATPTATTAGPSRASTRCPPGPSAGTGDARRTHRARRRTASPASTARGTG